MKIMIVEDDLILARELQLLCVKWNFQAKYLEDFKHVDQVYCTYQPDLILLDIIICLFMMVFTGVKR